MLTSLVSSSFVIETLRLSSALAENGDNLVADIDLGSARWSAPGAAARAVEPQSAAGLARNLALSRQAVQRIANDLFDGGFIAFVENPHHQRAHLVVMTAKGRKALAQAIERRDQWLADFVQGMSDADIM